MLTDKIGQILLTGSISDVTVGIPYLNISVCHIKTSIKMSVNKLSPAMNLVR